ncbi:hypothetical protein Pcinc_002381 [Petrolisthes cinctipes]|uniref:Uracil-DNA glycosylase-like domain-containing protein n=1 Tax=Petrolisthes cinctipes TaxID=88211 RepID=A0AAE1GJF9_PETCI|nr:hypothetical protein Pcinc_002381 [Petrolisthes cinctipes]
MPPKQKRQKIDHKSKGHENNGGGNSTGTPNTLQIPTDPASISQKFLDIEAEQCKELLKLQYGQGQLLVYNPLDYASQIHHDFVSKFCRGPKKVLLLGMNPGPWGMGQTGVPFGHVDYARDWLEVKGEVTKPVNEHEKRPISGLNCKRKEVSGDRMWSLLKQLSGTPEVLFTNIFLHNYCPLYFLKDSAKNVTPPELKVHERAELEKVCNRALVQVVDLLGVEHVIGVGNYAAERARKALTNEGREDIKVSTLMHPSPVNPAANKGWANIAIKQLTDNKTIEYFKSST